MPSRPVIPLHPAFDAGLQPSRRDLVKWLGASMALAASGCTRLPREQIYSYARLPELEAAGVPRFYASACLRNGHAEGVLIGTQQGRPVKVEGNVDHPASLGGTSVYAQAAVLQLWDPDRSTQAWQRDAAAHALPSTWAAFASDWRAHPATDALHVLTPAFTSPTLAAQLAELLSLRPGSRWYRDDGAASLAASRGAVMAFGREVRVVHRFDQAELIVAIGGDPFSDPVTGVRQSADWARARAAAEQGHRPPARLVALETTPGLFGARADERWALSPPVLDAVVAQVAGGWLPGVATNASGSAPPAIVARLIALLKRHTGRAILVGGPALSARSQATLHALNQALGAFAACAHAIDAPDRHAGVLPAPGSLAELVEAAHAGEVRTLVMLETNPVYAAPAHLRFEAALARVPWSVHFGTHRDETALQCRWHLPSGHAFEQWSDARAFDGSVTLLQPAIAPLYDTRSAHEAVALLLARSPAGRPAADGHDLVRAHWRDQWGPGAAADFETRWSDSLRRGVVADTALPPLPTPMVRPGFDPGPAPEPPVAGAAALWAVFPPDASVGEGEHANNGWLQELPRPFSKMAWGNALTLGPLTAHGLGVATGDRVRAHADGRTLDWPVWVDERHAEGAATLPSGGGRRAAGRVGNGVGIDNAALRHATDNAVALRLERIDGQHRFAVTQVEHGQQDRELARVAPPAPAVPGRPREAQPSLYPSDPPIAPVGPAWAMAIDLDACIGCNVCTIACQAENNIAVVGPDEVRAGRAMHWIRVDAWHDEPGQVLSQPVPCMHCENAPCELVCPVGATVHDSEGVNMQVYNRCIGTRFCSNNCPYKVRRFNYRQYSDVVNETARLQHNPDVTVRDRGVMEKCSYCVQRLSRARRTAQRSGQPLPSDSVQTACQSACPTGAIHFGDLNDPRSEVLRAKASPRHYVMLEELGTRPRTTYLARASALPKDEA